MPVVNASHKFTKGECMSLNIKMRQIGDVTILDCVGRITLGEGAGSLREIIRQLAKDGRKKIVLNLAETSYVDSTGISEMVSGFQHLCNHGAQLKLLALSKRVRDLLQITKLYTLFEVFDEEAAAVRSFGWGHWDS